MLTYTCISLFILHNISYIKNEIYFTDNIFLFRALKFLIILFIINIYHFKYIINIFYNTPLNNTKIKEKISQKQCFFFFLFPFFVNNNENKNSDRCINKMIIILRDNFTSKL
ncbi:hypothetical protein PFAG_03536 [Plasmodium falciparum Santa Lucia]|uniref:Uncharacterized protein n=1 Tax=Plasmodium falciparum Santa Lucia TaxID=478859 RepID=W7FWQ4_PLAFA|nr:hypothetical protein PFAG_03536 [Plasmodium falciparum Santa Lucia]